MAESKSIKEVLTQKEYYTYLFFKDLDHVLDSYNLDDCEFDSENMIYSADKSKERFYINLGHRIISELKREEEDIDG